MLQCKKIFVLVSSLAYDSLFFEFVHEVIREKLILGADTLTDSDIRIFFKDKSLQDERVAKWTAAVKKPRFRKSAGRANEVNYWLFDYPPENELEVRERIARLKAENESGANDFTLAVFDLYDIIIDFLENKIL